MHKCILCSNSSQRTINSNITYHSFPKNPFRRKRWLTSLKIDKCYNWHRVCSEHFKTTDFKQGEKRMLWQDAVPRLPNSESVGLDNEHDDNNLTSASNDVEFNNVTITSSNNSNSNSNYQNVSLNQSYQPIYPVERGRLSHALNSKVHSRIRIPCSVKNCLNRYSKRLSFFGYPNNENLRKIWIEKCRVENYINCRGEFRSNLRVCGRHFEDRMFLNTFKRNRLIKNAVPTIFYDHDDINNSQSIFNNSELNSTAGDISRSDDYKGVIITKEDNLTTIIIEPFYLKNIKCESEMPIELTHYNCCAPDCISTAYFLNNNAIHPEFFCLFCPSSDIVNDWSSIVGLQLTTDSAICERHFKPHNIIYRKMNIPNKGVRDIKSLTPGAIPSLLLKTYKRTIKRPVKFNDGYETVFIKKSRIQFIDKSNSESKDVSSPNCEIIDNTDIDIDPSTTILDHTLVNIVNDSTNESNINNILPKMLANNSLSITFQTNAKQSKLVSENESNGILESNLNSNDKPNNSFSQILQSNFQRILSKSLPNNSLSIIQNPDNTQKSPISIPEADNLKSTSEIKIEPIDSETNIQDNEQILISDSIEEINSTNLQSAQVIKFEPNDTSLTSLTEDVNASSSQSNYGQDVSETLTNSLLLINSEPKANEKEQIISNDYIEAVNAPTSSNLIPEIKSEPIDTDPTTSNYNFKSSTTLDLMQNKQGSVAMSETSDKSSPNTNICPEFINNQVSFLKSISPTDNITQTTNKPAEILKYTSLNPIAHHSKLNHNSNLTENQTQNKIIENNERCILSNVSSIYDIFKNIILPNVFWKTIINSEKKSIAFIQQDEFMEPIKSVYFLNTLVPTIIINNKRYEYNKTIKTKNELEDLLEKIDNIEICLGYDGYTDDTCIGYFEDTSEKFESCQNCRNLIKDEYLLRIDSVIKNKSNTIKILEKKVSEAENRILNIRKQIEQKKRKEKMHSILKAINPIPFLNALKPHYN